MTVASSTTASLHQMQDIVHDCKHKVRLYIHRKEPVVQTSHLVVFVCAVMLCTAYRSIYVPTYMVLLECMYDTVQCNAIDICKYTCRANGILNNAEATHTRITMVRSTTLQ